MKDVINMMTCSFLSFAVNVILNLSNKSYKCCNISLIDFFAMLGSARNPWNLLYSEKSS